MKLRTLTLRAVLVLAVLAALAALGLHWASRSQAVLRWGVAYAAERLPGKLVVEGLTGSLSAPVSIARLRYSNDTVDVEAEGVALVWSPWLLAVADRLSIEQLHADRLRIAVRGSNGPGAPAPPAHLRLPVAVAVEHLDVGKLTVQTGATTIALDAIALAYEGGTRFHHLRVDNVTTPWGSGKGQIELGAEVPFVLSGSADFTSAARPDWPCVVHARLNGNLEGIAAVLEAQVRELRIQGDARLAPFKSMPLESIAARTSGVNLARFAADAPETALDVTFDGRPTGNDTLQGQVTILNRLPGTLDRRRIPVQSLSGTLSASAQTVRVSDAVFDLGTAGRATGEAAYAEGKLTAALRTANLDLRGIHGALRATHLSGSASAVVSGTAQDFAVDLVQDKLRLIAKVRRQDDRLLVQALDLRSGTAQLQASGRLSLAAGNTFSAAGTLKRFDPAGFGDFPTASIDAEVAADGRLQPAWEVAVRYRLQPSTLRRQPLTGQGALKVAATRVSEVDAQLALAGNRVRLKGAFGRPGDSLDVDLDAPRLELVDRRLAGAATVSGKVSGTRERPGANLNLAARGLSWPGGYRADKLEARMLLQQSEDPAFDVEAHGQGLTAGKLTLQAAALKTAGTFNQHRIELQAKADDVDVAAQLEGQWQPSQREWTGRILSLQNRGDYAFKLAGVVPLAIGQQRFAFGPGQIDLPDGKVAIGDTRYRSGQLDSTGSFTGLPAARLLRAAKAPPAIQTSIKLGGRWNLAAADRVNGRIEVQRESGDVTVSIDEDRIALGVSKLVVNFDVVNDMVTGSLVAAARSVGDANARIETQLSERSGNWGIAGTAPLVLAAHAQIDSLKPLAALFTRAVVVGGALSLDLAANGTVAQPKLTGRADVTGLNVEQVENGVFLREGVMHAEFADRAMDLKQFTIRAGSGTFSARGTATAAGQRVNANLEWTADKMTAVQRPDLVLIVSGKGTVAIADEKVTLRGKLRADRGRVEVSSGNVPTLGDDVVVLGEKQRTPITSRIVDHDLALDVDLGSDFEIHGRGLDARLQGKLTFLSLPRTPITANGEISVARGTFEAFSRKLDIDEGKLIFTGPLDNPGLRIRAVRKNQQVEAGVEVSGTLRAPRVVLVSKPEVPDSEKLTWLVLGRKADATSHSDTQQLQSSAAILVANMGTSSLQNQVAQALGVDEVSFAPGESVGEGGVVTLAKRVTDRIYVMFEQSLSTATNAVKVNYQLTRRWSVRTETGTTDAIDLFYSFSFD